MRGSASLAIPMWGSRRIYVSPGGPKPHVDPTSLEPEFRVWLGGVPEACTTEDLGSLLKVQGPEVQRLWMSCKSPGEAIAAYSSLEDAAKAASVEELVFQRTSIRVALCWQEERAWRRSQKAKRAASPSPRCASPTIALCSPRWPKPVGRQGVFVSPLATPMWSPIGSPLSSTKTTCCAEADLEVVGSSIEKHSCAREPLALKLVLTKETVEVKLEKEAIGAQENPSTGPCSATRRRRKVPWAHVRRRLRLAMHRCARYRARCHRAEEQEWQATMERRATESAYASFVADVEVATECLAGEARVPLPPKPEEAAPKMLDFASKVGDCQRRVLGALSALQPLAHRAAKAKEVLEEVLRCPITHDIFVKPVLAPDGHVYEESWLVEWLKLNPVSPMIKIPMRPNDVRPDRVVEQATEALWLLRGEEQPAIEEPSSRELVHQAAGTGDPEVLRPILEDERPGLGLLQAITEGQEARALDLLQQSGVIDGLNDYVGEEGATLLHMALLNELPATALAIAQHPHFTEHVSFMGGPLQMVSPLHIAAALGLQHVCEAVLEHSGGGFAIDPLPSRVTLHLKSGVELRLRRGHNAHDLAVRNGHTQLAEVLNDAIKRFMDGW